MAENEAKKRQRIYGVGRGQLNADERLELAKLLIKAGYSARVGSERQNSKANAANIYFVEYWQD